MGAAKLRTAIIGAGLLTRDAHLPVVLGNTDAELVAVIDTDTNRAQEACDRYGVNPIISDDISTLLSDLDAVVIATPNHTHYSIAKTCLEGGVHVLLEKPLATNAQDASSLKEISSMVKKVLKVGYCFRDWKSVNCIKDYIKEGAFGKVVNFLMQHGSVGGWEAASGYITSREQTGGGVMVINGTHALDRMLYLFGYPEKAEMRDDSNGGGEATAMGYFDYGDFQGAVKISKTCPYPSSFAIEFETATVIHREYASPTLTVRMKSDPSNIYILSDKTMQPENRGNVFAVQFADFVDQCFDKKPYSVDEIELAVDNVRLIEALYQNRQPLVDNYFVFGKPESLGE